MDQRSGESDKEDGGEAPATVPASQCCVHCPNGKGNGEKAPNRLWQAVAAVASIGAAFATIGVLILNFCALTVITETMKAAQRTSRASQRSAKAARGTFEASQSRPWVLLRDIAVKGSLTNGGPVTFVGEFKNEGGSPAFNLDVLFSCWVDKFVHEDAAYVELRGAMPVKLAPIGRWLYLGRDAERGRQSTVTVNADDFNTRRIAVYCTASVRYRWPGGTKEGLTLVSLQYVPHEKRTTEEWQQTFRVPPGHAVLTAANDADSDFMPIGGPRFNYAK